MSIARQVVFLVFLAVAGGLGWLVYDERRSEDAQVADVPAARAGARSASVEVAIAQTRTLDRSVEAVGTTRALQSVDIVPLSDGIITKLNIVPGREVDAGAVLARLDPGIEEATLAEAEATLVEKTGALDRSRTLQRANSPTVSEATLDTLRAEQAIAAAAVQRARQRLDERTVRAPFAGVLGIGAMDLGARVETSTVLTTLDDLSQVEIEFRLPETVYGQIRAGQRVDAASAAFPARRFTGTVEAIDSRIDPVSRAFRVRARLPNDDRALPVGMFMRLELALDDRRGVVVPEEALLIEGGEPNVFVVADGVSERRTIRIGLRRNGLVEVLDGVAAGEAVVSRGIQSLRDGMTVNVVGRTDLPEDGETTTAPSAAGAAGIDGVDPAAEVPEAAAASPAATPAAVVSGSRT